MIINTLWPHWTDSERAAKHYLETNRIDWEIWLHNSFEIALIKAIESTKEKTRFLIPAAYPKIHNAFFNPNIKGVDTFMLDTMPMVLFENKEVENSEIWIHTATRSLLKGVEDDFEKVIEYASKQEGLKNCAEWKTRYSIASDQELLNYKNLTEKYNFWSFPMAWVLFKTVGELWEKK
jgi:hypothetical protein